MRLAAIEVTADPISAHNARESSILFQWRALAENALALYGVQVSAFLLPLVTVPYLARVLGPAQWGRVAMAQAFAAYVALVIEYGFHLSGARDVARARNCRDRLSSLVASVLWARVFLSFCLVPGAAIATRFVPQLDGEQGLVWAAYSAGVAQGFTPTWFYQGLEQMRLVAALELTGRAVTTLAILILVRKQDDAALVLWLQAIGGSLVATLGYGLAFIRFVSLRGPTWRDVVSGLRLGGSMFAFRVAVSLYTVGNALLLGLFVPAHLVGYYAGAERIVRALQGLFSPISQALYPRVSYLAHRSRHDAARFVLWWMRPVTAGALVVHAVTVAGASAWVRLFLGEEFGPAAPVLRLLTAIVPLVAVSNMLGFQWMLPLGLDRSFNSIIVSAGMLHVTLALVFVPRLGPLGMAVAVVASEVFVTTAMCAYLRLRRLDPRSALSDSEAVA